MTQQSQEVPLEVLTPSALESIERASVDVQVSTAHRFPRSLEQFKKRAMDMVQQDLETAESCIYSRPVGKGDDGKQKYAEGASIRMAEIVAACYGNIRVGARIVEQTERYVKAEGVAHDLESNYAAKSEAMESTVKRNGQPYDERMRIVVAKAALSKALRDAVFRVVPKALCKSVYDAAQKVIAGQAKTLDQRRKAVQQWLATIKVDDARTFAALGVNGWSEIGEQQLLTLTGLKTGIKDNELTVDEAFPHVGASASGAKPADVSDLGPVAGKPIAAAGATGATAGNATPQPAPTQPEAPKAAETPQTAPAGTQAAKEPPTCAYCGQPSLQDHSCPGLQEAIAKQQQRTGTPAEQEAQEKQERTDLLASIELMQKQNNLSEAQFKAWVHANKLVKDKQKINDVSTTKLRSINSAMSKPETIKEIAKFPA